MADYSKAYFSYERAEPRRLPKRFKNSKGQAFYSFNCTLEQIESSGYTGPIEKPLVGEGQQLVWNSETITYEVQPKSAQQLAEEEDKEVRKEIDANLQNVIDVNDTDLTSAFRSAYSSHYGELYSLKSQKRLLSWSDYPQTPSGLYSYQSQYNELKNSLVALASGSLDRFQYGFEYTGNKMSELREGIGFNLFCEAYGEPDWVASGVSEARLQAWEAYSAADGFNNEEVTFNG